MPELPEIYNIAVQMDRELAGKRIIGAEVRQEKCLNVPLDNFLSMTIDETIDSVCSKGKWIFVRQKSGNYMLISLGMGGDILFHQNEASIPEKYQFKFSFNDKTLLTIGFWWFGYVHTMREEEMRTHKMTAELGISPMEEREFTLNSFLRLLDGKRGSIKTFLMDQKNIAGIGNVYIQDILFIARLHPLRKISEMNLQEKEALYNAIKSYLNDAVRQGGIAYEKDLYGRRGKIRSFLVGYKENMQCPNCKTEIVKIKTGSTSSFICPNCQQ